MKWGGELRFWGALWGREDGEDLPAEPALTAEGDRPQSWGRDTGRDSPGMVIWVQGSVLGPSAKAWAFLGLSQPRVTEGSSRLAGV